MNDSKLYAKTESELKAIDNTVDIFSKVIGMKYGVGKCAKVIIHRRKYKPAEGLPTSTCSITEVSTDKGYKYLGVLQTKKNMQNKIKDETKQNTSKESNKY